MSEHYDFHYQPTGSGAISGQQVLEQTEDAINELGDYVNDNVGGAMDVAQQALETAQNAEQDAQTALDTANSFSSAIQSAQQDASTALSTAQTAQTTASNANNTAIQAQQDASSAVTTANNASGQVSTLSGTVTTLGQRVTTAEGNIGQNTSDITALTTRVGTAEGNITTLQNDVTIAQGNASSAMATAGQVKQQAFVFRYSSTALVASSTNSNALLDNTDNLKVGDKVIDSSGVLFSITAIDTQNSTFTIGTALIDLAQDSDVVHTSGDETVGGKKTFSDRTTFSTTSVNGEITLKQNAYDPVTNGQSSVSGTYNFGLNARAATNGSFGQIAFYGASGFTATRLLCRYYTGANVYDESYVEYVVNGTSGSITDKCFKPSNNGLVDLGSNANAWKRVYAQSYYYGSTNVEFSTKFVTTDTAQTISGAKTFSSSVNVYNSDNATDIAHLVFKNQKAEKGGSSSGSQLIYFTDKLVRTLATIRSSVGTNGQSILGLRVDNIDSNNNAVYSGFFINSYKDGTKNIVPNTNGDTDFGTETTKWKSFNGLEPSSLSLPSGNVSDVIDISSYITDLSGNVNSYTVPANGWISIAVIGNFIAIVSSSWSDSRLRASSGNVRMLYPVLKNETVSILIEGTTLAYARFIPCQGNV